MGDYTNEISRLNLAFCSAATRGHFEIVKMLFDAGANFDDSDSKFRTAWGPAAEGGYIEVVQILLTKLKETNLSGPERQWGLTLTLVAAAKSGNLQLIRLLLEAGAAVNIPRERTYIGMTAMQAAAERGHQEVVKLLVEKGADFEVSYLYLED